ncbi:hypothetical protein Cni_G16324 [Canna indica]|uniref:Uncharacterized protein n=1 Tax=Canna indica TaxID=4628 RepID=A0AAQ3KHJ9_9LILI|nr:hypothetical protein Cni_G16324 [Canna indica]
MDYDDIEFQSQNFELVVEDNNKFPQSLHSFSLPKFDIDEHLEVHHTFDSLAETEVLLDIQHQENNWIEDFSPRNSAVEFSSSAAESCSFPRQNNVWSEATSSEPVEMLLKSVGEHEMANQQVIDKVTDAQTFNDSNNSRMMEPLPNDSSLLPSAKCDNSISRSNENVDKGQKQFEGFSQSPKDGTSPVELDRSSLGEKSSSDGQAISEQCIIDDKLTSSSDCAKREHPVVDESLRIYRSDIPVENSFIQGSDDDRGASNLPPRSTPVSLVCNTTQNAPSSVSTDNTSMGPENMKTQSCLIEEYHEIDIRGKLEVVQCDKLQNAESWISVTGDKVNDKDLHVHSVNNDSCNLEDFSFIEPPMCSSTLLNEGLCINRSDGLLQSIAYQANVFNKENGTAVIVSSSAKNLPSLAIEKEGNVRHPIETSNGDMAGLLHMSDGSINASHIETEYQVKDDSLHQSALPTKSANVDFGAERGTANFDAIFAERQELKGQYLTKTELETGCTQVNNDNKVEVDPVMLSTKKLEPDVMVKSTEVGVAKDSTDITKSSPDTKKLDSLENSTLCVSGKEVKVSAVADGKSIIESIELTVVSDTCETNINHLQMPVNINQILPPSTDPCDSSATEDCPHVMKKMKAHSSLDQRNVDLSLVGDKSSMTSSTATHEHSEVMLACNTVAELGGLSASSLTASVCNEKDVNMSSLSVTNSNLDTHMLNQPFREPDAVVKSSPKDRILDVSGLLDENGPNFSEIVNCGQSFDWSQLYI